MVRVVVEAGDLQRLGPRLPLQMPGSLQKLVQRNLPVGLALPALEAERAEIGTAVADLQAGRRRLGGVEQELRRAGQPVMARVRKDGLSHRSLHPEDLQSGNPALQFPEDLSSVFLFGLGKRLDQRCRVPLALPEGQGVHHGVVVAVADRLAGQAVRTAHDDDRAGGIGLPFEAMEGNAGTKEERRQVDQLDRIAVRDQDQVERAHGKPAPQAQGLPVRRGALPLPRQEQEVDGRVVQDTDALAVQVLVGSGLHHIAERG